MSAALHPLPACNPITRPDCSVLGAGTKARATEAHAVQPCTAAQLAAAAGVSRRMIFLALKVHRDGCAELQAMTIAGRATMNLAAVLVDMFPNHDDQRAVLAELPTLPKREWLGFARRVAALVKGDS
jgi:hypothetical protein